MAQAINLQITPSNVMPKIYASQFDIGREIEISLYDGASAYTPPVGTDIRFEGKKPDGNGFSYACTYTGNVVTVVTTDQMTVLAGEIPCELRMSLNGNDIGTLNIIFVIEKSPIDENVPISDTEIPAIVELARDEQYTAEAWAIGERNGVPVGPTDPTYHNNAKYWAEHAQHGSLDMLSDVEITTPTNGQALIYDANTDEWVNGDVVDALDDLSDTNITAPTDGQALVYDADNDEWINGDVSTVEKLSELADTDITTPVDNDGLVYDSTSQKWENKPVVTGDLWVKNGAHNHLYNRTSGSNILGGITITTNSDDKSITVGAGTSTSTDNIMLSGSLPSWSSAEQSLTKGQYRASMQGSDVPITLVIEIEDDGVHGNITVQVTGNQVVTFTISRDCRIYAYLLISSGETVPSGTLKPMITSIDDPSTEYAPYAKTNRQLTTDKYLDNSSSYTSLDTTITTTFTAPADGLYLIAAKCNNATSSADVYLQNGSSPILTVLGVDVMASQLVYLKAGTTLYTRSDKGTYVVRGYYKA